MLQSFWEACSHTACQHVLSVCTGPSFYLTAVVCYLPQLFLRAWDIVVCAVTGLLDGRLRVGFPVSARDLFSKTSRPACCPPSLLFSGFRGHFPGVKATGVWFWQPPTSAEVKNEWSYTSSIYLHGIAGIIFFYSTARVGDRPIALVWCDEITNNR